MTASRIYASFCLAVVCFFVYSKYEGWVAFGSGAGPPHGSSSGGGHGTGVFVGAHK